MNHRSIFIRRTSVLLLIIAIMLITPHGYAFEWSTDTRLTTDDYVDWWPALTSTAEGEIWAAWRSNRLGDDEIFYKTFNGSEWTQDMRLTWENHTDNHPSIMQASDGKIWVVWESDRNEHDQDIYFKVFDGSEWTADEQLTTNPSDDAYPSIMQATNGDIWVVWASPRTGNSEIFYTIFNGTSWSNATQLTTDLDAQNWDPSILQAADGLIWVVFTKTSDGQHEDIYFKIFDGLEWSPDWQLTFHTKYDSYPSIAQTSDGAIWVVWQSDRDVNENIYYMVRAINGSWSAETKLTTHSSDDVGPSIAQALDQTIWIAWGSLRGTPPNFDLYYKINSHDVAVTEILVPATRVLRGETAPIEVVALNRGTESEIFDVECYANTTLVQSKEVSLISGQSQTLTFQWNTTGVAPGSYIISATAIPVSGEGRLDDNSLTDGTVEVRIPGDFCGSYQVEPGVWRTLPIPDGRVDIDDFGTAIGQYGTFYPSWNPTWGPAADVNMDLVVDIDDLLIIAIHFGET